MLYGVVLAGGRSSRMGRNKALLRCGGESLLERAERVLREAGVERLLLSGTVPGREEGLRDAVPGQGPPGALHAVVKHVHERWGLHGDALLVIPVDMPGLEPWVLRLLLAAQGDAGAAHFRGEVFPCVLSLDSGLKDLLDNAMAEADHDDVAQKGPMTMRRILASREAVAVPMDSVSAAVFGNINTPDDWQHYCSRQSIT